MSSLKANNKIYITFSLNEQQQIQLGGRLADSIFVRLGFRVRGESRSQLLGQIKQELDWYGISYNGS